jgi:hypothetical protein
MCTAMFLESLEKDGRKLHMSATDDDLDPATDVALFNRIAHAATALRPKTETPRGVFIMLLTKLPDGTVRSTPGFAGVPDDIVRQALARFLADPPERVATFYVDEKKPSP